MGRRGGGGSSPHTRGAPVRPHDSAAVRGIIPAYAGSTKIVMVGVCCHWDHPRIRGEHIISPPTKVLYRGSSPHTRGAHVPRPSQRQAPGIIPAYAGSTPTTSGQVGGEGDHPRIRGEHLSTCINYPLVLGSSPHTRGARLAKVPRVGPHWIIPAYAGSTRPGRSDRKPQWDHPRIRGEHPISTL